jgi:hypothetical protein
MEKVNVEKLVIDGCTYVREDKAQMAQPLDGMRYCIIRTYSAGVHAGYVESRNGEEVTLRNARRIYYWAGAATLSEMANEGVAKPKECKFPAAVAEITLTNAIEVIPCTEKARESLQNVPAWSARSDEEK